MFDSHLVIVLLQGINVIVKCHVFLDSLEGMLVLQLKGQEDIVVLNRHVLNYQLRLEVLLAGAYHHRMPKRILAALHKHVVLLLVIIDHAGRDREVPLVDLVKDRGQVEGEALVDVVGDLSDYAASLGVAVQQEHVYLLEVSR